MGKAGQPNPGWRKSTYTTSGGNENCVELGQARGQVLVRDTKGGGSGPVLEFSSDTWTRFTRSIKG